MKYNVTKSKYNDQLLKDAEERIDRHVQSFGEDDYTYEIMMIPTGVICDKYGRPCVILNPDNTLIRK